MIFERENGPRNEGSAITMWPNAFRVFDALGVGDLIRADHAPVTR
jgi:2-polyprenyl-6-methoxyphenol hydroxylase-like FAD-dependent oxidoreductase